MAATTVPAQAADGVAPAVSASSLKTQPTGPQRVAATLDAGQYSGEELLRGFFFLTGPVVKLFPELKEAHAQAIEAGYKPDSEAEKLVFAEVERANHGFMARFAADMVSGDHLRVQDALTKAVAAVKSAAEAIAGPGATGEAGAHKVTAVAGPVVLIAVVAVGWLVAGGTIAVVADVAFWDGVMGDNGVAQDKVVDLVVKRFATLT